MRSIVKLSFLAFSTMAKAFQNNPDTIRKILTESKTIALVGASPKPQRASHYVMEFLMQQGYNVIPVNPVQAGKVILGKEVVASLKDISEPIDMVDVFRNSNDAGPVIDEAIEVGAKSVWLQMGVVNGEGAQRATDAGLDFVQNVCPKVEIPRLGLMKEVDQRSDL